MQFQRSELDRCWRLSEIRAHAQQPLQSDFQKQGPCNTKRRKGFLDKNAKKRKKEKKKEKENSTTGAAQVATQQNFHCTGKSKAGSNKKNAMKQGFASAAEQLQKEHVSAPKKVSEEGKRAASVQHAAPQSMPMLHQPAMGMASVSTLQVQGHHNAAPQRMERTPLQPLQPCIPGATHPTNTAPFAAYNALADGQTGWGSMCRMPGISMGFAGLHDVHNTTLPTAQPQVFDTRTVPPTIPWPTIGGARNVGTAHGGFLHAQRHGALSSAL